jgi:hypothetical protein
MASIMRKNSDNNLDVSPLSSSEWNGYLLQEQIGTDRVRISNEVGEVSSHIISIRGGWHNRT